MKKFLLLVSYLSLLLASSACDGAQESQPEIPIQVNLKETFIELHKGETYTLQFSVSNWDAYTSGFSWKSSNEWIATIDNGVVKANNQGNCEISLEYKNTIYAKCKVKVSPLLASSITLESHELEIIEGESVLLNATIAPENAENQDVRWSSSDESIATVSEQGMITAKTVGEVIISAVVEGTQVSDRCVVVVLPRKVTGITVQGSVNILLGETYQLKASVEPQDATNKKIIWESSNPEIASIDKTGCIRGVALGDAIITATTEDGNFKATSAVSICEMDKFVSAITGVGTEGSTTSGFYSYLSLTFRTNVEQSVFIKSIVLEDENGILKVMENPNRNYTIFENKYLTVNHGITNVLSTYRAIGWKFIITYTWNGKEYEFIHVHRDRGYLADSSLLHTNNYEKQ